MRGPWMFTGGHNVGLLVAEIELGRPDEEFSQPTWLGREITFDPRYRNSALRIAPIARTEELERAVA